MTSRCDRCGTPLTVWGHLSDALGHLNPTDMWEFVHRQTFERVGLVLTTRKAVQEHGAMAFELGLEVEREKYQPSPPTAPVPTLRTV